MTSWSARTPTRRRHLRALGRYDNAISQGPTNGNLPLDAQFAGSSTDGSKVFFVTQEALVAEDTDGDRFDVYERAGTTTTLVSPRPSGSDVHLNAAFEGASDDGSRVFFSTSDASSLMTRTADLTSICVPGRR